VAKAPLQKMPIIGVPFQMVGIDLVGPITPPSNSANRFILCVVDYATRYPEAVALPGVSTEQVAEALCRIFSRVGVPKQILSDQGSQFVSDVIKEVYRLLSIQHISNTPYHPQANGLVEKFNGTLKSMIKKLCLERPSDWDRKTTNAEANNRTRKSEYATIVDYQDTSGGTASSERWETEETVTMSLQQLVNWSAMETLPVSR